MEMATHRGDACRRPYQGLIDAETRYLRYAVELSGHFEQIAGQDG